MAAGYSGTPLVKKLGIKSGFKVYFRNPPDKYDQTLGELPADVTILNKPNDETDFIQVFSKSRLDLENEFPKLKSGLAQNGILWVSWPKKSAKVETDLTGNIVREIGLNNGLVDIKVCAVDEIWSGLKFVYRVKDRL